MSALISPLISSRDTDIPWLSFSHAWFLQVHELNQSWFLLIHMAHETSFLWFIQFTIQYRSFTFFIALDLTPHLYILLNELPSTMEFYGFNCYYYYSKFMIHVHHNLHLYSLIAFHMLPPYKLLIPTVDIRLHLSIQYSMIFYNILGYFIHHTLFPIGL